MSSNGLAKCVEPPPYHVFALHFEQFLDGASARILDMYGYVYMYIHMYMCVFGQGTDTSLT